MKILLRDDKEYTQKLRVICEDLDVSPTQLIITLINHCDATIGACIQDEIKHTQTTGRDTN